MRSSSRTSSSAIARASGGVYWLVPSGARGPRLVNNTIADNLATVAGRGSVVFADRFDVSAAPVNNALIAPAGQRPRDQQKADATPFRFRLEITKRATDSAVRPAA